MTSYPQAPNTFHETIHSDAIGRPASSLLFTWKIVAAIMLLPRLYFVSGNNVAKHSKFQRPSILNSSALLEKHVCSSKSILWICHRCSSDQSTALLTGDHVAQGSKRVAFFFFSKGIVTATGSGARYLARSQECTALHNGKSSRPWTAMAVTRCGLSLASHRHPLCCRSCWPKHFQQIQKRDRHEQTHAFHLRTRAFEASPLYKLLGTNAMKRTKGWPIHFNGKPANTWRSQCTPVPR